MCSEYFALAEIFTLSDSSDEWVVNHCREILQWVASPDDLLLNYSWSPALQLYIISWNGIVYYLISRNILAITVFK